jgi:hypothetical protein
VRPRLRSWRRALTWSSGANEAFGELDVGSPTLRIESLGWHQQRPREALGRLLVVVSAAPASPVSTAWL